MWNSNNFYKNGNVTVWLWAVFEIPDFYSKTVVVYPIGLITLENNLRLKHRELSHAHSKCTSMSL